jgi:hypothetical protein
LPLFAAVYAHREHGSFAAALARTARAGWQRRGSPRSGRLTTGAARARRSRTGVDFVVTEHGLTAARERYDEPECLAPSSSAR